MTPTQPGTRAVIAAMRQPAALVPGWFPLVVERVHRLLGLAGEQEVGVDGLHMTVDVDEYIQRRLFYRCHEPNEARLVRGLLGPGDVFVDVGAHVGFFTLIGAARVGDSGHVYAFEPLPANYSTLERNIRQNNLGNVTLSRAAVTDRSGEVKLGLDDERLIGRSTGDFTIGGAHDSLDVAAISLDDYFARIAESRRLRLVKMDVEGLEPQVLAGAERMLAEMTPDAILFEQNAALLQRRGHAAHAVTQTLERKGYELHRIAALGRLPQVDDVSDDIRDDSSPRSSLAAGLASRKTLFNVLAVRRGVHLGRAVRR